LQKRSADIFDSYVRIMHSVGLSPLERERFNARMNNLKKLAYAEILTGTRQGWYEYREKVIRGYARLRAEQKGITLEIEHPLQKRRYGMLKGVRPPHARSQRRKPVPNRPVGFWASFPFR
jgi:hypothetical protein